MLYKSSEDLVMMIIVRIHAIIILLTAITEID
jgi:hypothetical protein